MTIDWKGIYWNKDTTSPTVNMTEKKCQEGLRSSEAIQLRTVLRVPWIWLKGSDGSNVYGSLNIWPAPLNTNDLAIARRRACSLPNGYQREPSDQLLQFFVNKLMAHHLYVCIWTNITNTSNVALYIQVAFLKISYSLSDGNLGQTIF